MIAEFKAWRAELRAKIAANTAADAKLAEVNIRNLKAGILDETEAYNTANDAAWETLFAVPFAFRIYADSLSRKANQAAWDEAWALADKLEAQGPRLVTPPTARQLEEWLSEHEKVWLVGFGDRCVCGWHPDSWDTEEEFEEWHRGHVAEELLALLNGTAVVAP